MLVLAHAYGFGFDLHQLGQRVLQTARNADCAAQADIELREFFGRKFAGAIDRSARLAHHHFGNYLFGFGQHGDDFARQLVGLAAGSAIADRHQGYAMQFAQFRQRKHAVIPIAARLVGINGIGRQQFARGIHHRHFHAGAYARV